MNPHPEPIRINAPASRQLLVLGALLLFLAQAVMALHAIDHLGDEGSESCQVCLVGGGLDQSTVDSSGPSSVIHPAPAATPIQTPSHGTSRTLSFRQRAPPHSPSV